MSELDDRGEFETGLVGLAVLAELVFTVVFVVAGRFIIFIVPGVDTLVQDQLPPASDQD